MVSLQELKAKCPADAWAKHRFSTAVELGHGGHIVLRFDVPPETQQRPVFDTQSVQDKFKDVLGISADDKEVCGALADLLNVRMQLVYKTVSIQLQLATTCLDALSQNQLIKSWLMLRELTKSLVPYQADLWVYEWPQWVFLVESFILSAADEETRKIIENLYKWDEIE